MNDAPRRRRLDPEEPKGGLPIFPLIIVVVLAGFLLGGLLSRLHKSPATPVAEATAPTITPIPQATATLAPRATPLPAVSASASPSATPSPHARASASATASSTPSAAPTASASVAPTSTPTAAPTVIFITPAPKATKRATPVPTPSPTPKPTATPTPVQITGAASADHAAAIVSSYLAALARGQQSLATGYLMRGLPNESFMSAAARVSGVQSTKNADGSFKVTADIATPTGEYFETFKVEPGPQGLQISDHFAIKVQ
ncbi:MAG: hypothetical protein KGN02_06860 [bacterium]|nr:hypothetical protein [bacterium]